MGYLSPLLAARDTKETIEFYRDKLGFQVGMLFPDADSPEYADLSRDGMILMFIPAQNMGVGLEEQLGKGVNLYMEIDGDIDLYYQELKGKGVKIVQDIRDEPFGIRDFVVEDINGYMLTFNRAVAKNCISCGMPMAKAEDFGGEDPENVTCVHCSNPDGSPKSYDEVLRGMANFMVTTQGTDRETAEWRAREHMARMPAWRGK